MLKIHQIFQEMQIWENKYMQVCTEWITDLQLFWRIGANSQSKLKNKLEKYLKE